MRKTLEERFWEKVDKKGSDECWEWVACLVAGYGLFGGDQKVEMAHRVSWKLHYGLIPNGLCVLHRCDNPPCVNPVHLFLGTHADNMRDRDQKGRGKVPDQKGEANSGAKLTAEDVREIRRRIGNGEKQQALADEFDVVQPSISHIIHGRTWRHVS